MSDELKGFTSEYSKQMILHIEELAAAFAKKTNLPPDKIKLVQLQSMDFPNYKLTSWFEPLDNEEIEIYSKRAEAAEAKILEATRWIPVTERLPEKDKKVLLYDSWSGQIDSGTLRRIDGHDEAIQEGIYEWEINGCYYHGYNFERITHWRELPQPPREEK